MREQAEACSERATQLFFWQRGGEHNFGKARENKLFEYLRAASSRAATEASKEASTAGARGRTCASCKESEYHADSA